MRIDGTTFILELLNFAVLAALLGRYLFRPVREVIARRERSVRERLDAAAARAREASDERAALAGERERFEAERSALLDAARAEARAEHARIVAGAREAAARLLGEGRLALGHEREQAARDLAGEVTEAAAALSAAALARLGGPGVVAMLADRLAERLAGLSGDERAELRREAARGGARIRWALPAGAPAPPAAGGAGAGAEAAALRAALAALLGDAAPAASLDSAAPAAPAVDAVEAIDEDTDAEAPTAAEIGVRVEIGTTSFEATLGALVASLTEGGRHADEPARGPTP